MSSMTANTSLPIFLNEDQLVTAYKDDVKTDDVNMADIFYAMQVEYANVVEENEAKAKAEKNRSQSQGPSRRLRPPDSAYDSRSQSQGPRGHSNDRRRGRLDEETPMSDHRKGRLHEEIPMFDREYSGSPNSGFNHSNPSHVRDVRGRSRVRGRPSWHSNKRDRPSSQNAELSLEQGQRGGEHWGSYE